MLVPTTKSSSSIFNSNIIRVLATLFVLWSLIEVLYIHKAVHAPQPPPLSPAHSQRIFIASLHYNNAALLRDYWNDAVVQLSKTLGLANVYVSAYESGSSDDTKNALLELNARLLDLGVQRSIVLSNETHADQIIHASPDDGWVEDVQGSRELRRIPYLARLRNLSLKPLEDLARIGVTFDKILFLNDVVFQTEDVLRLLHTNKGEYAAACALDFMRSTEFYDTFALFDTQGDQYWTRSWPYFRSAKSRTPLMRGEPVPVRSCWNGMAMFDAAPFYATPSRAALRFRAVPDSLAQYHVEASECCLIHVDNMLSATKGVWVNPNVRVAYNGHTYDMVKDYDQSLTPASIFARVWYNRLRGWFMKGVSKDWIVMPRFRDWEAASPANREAGAFCLLNEMHVLTAAEWKHV